MPSMPFNYLPDIETRKPKPSAYQPPEPGPYDDSYRGYNFALLPNVTAARDVSVTPEMKARGPKSLRNKSRAVNETNAISGPLGGYASGSNPAERTMNAAGGMDVNAPSRGLMGAMNPNNIGLDFANYAGQKLMNRPGSMDEVYNTNAPSGTYAPMEMPQDTPQGPLSTSEYSFPSPRMVAGSPAGGYINPQPPERPAVLPPIYNNKSYSEEDPFTAYAGKVQEADQKMRVALGKAPSPLSIPDLATQQSGMQASPYTDLMGELAPPPDPRLQAEQELHGYTDAQGVKHKGKGALWRAGQFGLGLLGGVAAGNPVLGLYNAIQGATGKQFVDERTGEIQQQQEAKRQSALDRFNIRKAMGQEQQGEDRIELSRVSKQLDYQQKLNKINLDQQALEAKVQRYQDLGVYEQHKTEIEQEKNKIQEAYLQLNVEYKRSQMDSAKLKDKLTEQQTELTRLRGETEGSRKKDIEAGTTKKQAETGKIGAETQKIKTGSTGKYSKEQIDRVKEKALQELKQERRSKAIAELGEENVKLYELGGLDPSDGNKIKDSEIQSRAIQILDRESGKASAPASPSTEKKTYKYSAK